MPPIVLDYSASFIIKTTACLHEVPNMAMAFTAYDPIETLLEEVKMIGRAYTLSQ